MGFVYDALDTRTHRHLALKVLRPDLLDDEDSVRRFRQEATVLAAVKSEHVVPIMDAGFDAALASPFLTMELLRGCHLGEVLASEGRLPAPTALDLLGQLSRALDAVHRRQIVHRDLKPENLFLVRRSDGSLDLRVLDFGIAKLLNRSQRHTTLCMGTPQYIPPEQIRGDRALDQRADVYAFGQLTFTLLVGGAYWEVLCGTEASYHHQLLRASAGCNVRASEVAAEAGSVLPKGFDEWFRRATHREPQGRFSSAGEAMEVLMSLAFERGGARQARYEERLRALVKQREVESETAMPESVASGEPTRMANNHSRSRTHPFWKWGAAASVVALLVSFGAFQAKHLGREKTSALDRPALAPNTEPQERAGLGEHESQRRPGKQPPLEKRAFDDSVNVPARRSRTLGMPTKTEACPAPHYIDARGIKRFRPECLGEASTRVVEAVCDVPFVIDEQGIKRYRSSCLEMALAKQATGTSAP